MTDETIPWSKNGWEGYVADYRGTPIGMLVIRAKKGSRIIHTRPLTAQQVQEFDPDVYWGHQVQHNKEQT